LVSFRKQKKLVSRVSSADSSKQGSVGPFLAP